MHVRRRSTIGSVIMGLLMIYAIIVMNALLVDLFIRHYSYLNFAIPEVPRGLEKLFLGVANLGQCGILNAIGFTITTAVIGFSLFLVTVCCVITHVIPEVRADIAEFQRTLES